MYWSGRVGRSVIHCNIDGVEDGTAANRMVSSKHGRVGRRWVRCNYGGLAVALPPKKRPLQKCRGRKFRGTTSIYCACAASAGPISPWRCIGRSRSGLLESFSRTAQKGISTPASRCLAPPGSSLKGQYPLCTRFPSSRWVWMHFSTRKKGCQGVFGKKHPKNSIGPIFSRAKALPFAEAAYGECRAQE